MISFIVQGALVLFSYLLFWPDHDILAGLKNKIIFVLWGCSATLSAIGFCTFSGYLFVLESDDPVFFWCLFPYALFLTSAALYMPLAAAKYKVGTFLVLLAAALSSCLLVYCSVILFGLDWVTFLIGVLAFHCSFVDLVFWDGTWNMELMSEQNNHC